MTMIHGVCNWTRQEEWWDLCFCRDEPTPSGKGLELAALELSSWWLVGPLLLTRPELCGGGTHKTEIFKLSITHEVQIQFQECWPAGKVPVTEILYVRLHQRIKIDASQHVSHSCTLQLRASLLGDMAESLERAEHPFPVMGATLGSPQPPPAARGLVFTEEDMPSRQLLLVGYAEQDCLLCMH
ncbi:uncharacterized protein [Agelaius tricolor]|uniref:uncharacterized protein isoform X2 n=1 Tax=Agelaius tricolor TaxID=9191 RepID=UPI0039F220A4